MATGNFNVLTSCQQDSSLWGWRYRQVSLRNRTMRQEGMLRKKKKKNLASGLGHTQVCSQLCHLLAVWPPGGYFTSLGLSLLSCQVR